ncbi:polyhomeotic-proximal chromatin protein-like isoform X2 [Montipora foliosa]
MNKQREKSLKSLPKGRGKETEFRSKKQKNELHILKMSQEWDLRRQKRRLDRQKWVEERRNQKLPIWQRVGNLRVQANEEILTEAGNELVNKKQQFENSNKAEQSTISNNDNMIENLLEPREKGMANELLVQTQRFAEGTAQRTSLGKNQNEEPEIKFIKIEQATRTVEQPLLYNVNLATVAQITEHGSISALNCSSKSLDSQPKGILRECETSLEKAPKVSGKSELPSASIQNVVRVDRTKDASKNGEPERACADRKRKIEAISVDNDLREMPSLMRVDKPTTLESIERQNRPVTISSSANESVIIKPVAGDMGQNANRKGEAMPQIKQCYSLLDRREETPNVNLFAIKTSPNNSASVPVPVASPVTSTTAASEVKSQAASPSAAVDSKCIVYLSKAPASVVSTPGSSSHSRSAGYLVPVYKANNRETACALLPSSGAQRPHRVGEKSGLEERLNDNKTDSSIVGCTTMPHYAAHSFPCPRSTVTGVKEAHAGCVFSTGKFTSYSQPPPVLHREPILPTARVHSCHELVHTNIIQGPSHCGDSVHTIVGPTLGGCKNHVAKVHHEPTLPQKTNAVYSIGSLRPETAILSVVGAPLTDEMKGAQAAPEKLHFQALNRSTEVTPNPSSLNPQEVIYNPMSFFVRAKLVPREVVTVSHGAEPSSPLVQYIKTNAICDRELTKWTAKNVADFISATDCADKAELFVEQEIDGKALLSLSPEMLMKGLNLKLGPSVKLYNHIANLRTALLL